LIIFALKNPFLKTTRYLQLTGQIELLHSAIDASWEEDDAFQCFLNILISGNHCVGTVFDKSQQRFVLLKSFYSASGPEEFASEEWIRENFGLEGIPKKIFGSGFKTLLVPDALYKEESGHSLLALNHALAAGEAVKTEHLRNVGAQMLYTSREGATPDAGHSSAAWLECLSLQYKNDETDHIHIDFEGDKIDVAFFRKGSLHLFNSFLCTTDEDRLYYPLFISEQLRINPKKDRYYLSGFIEKNSSVHELFSKYIKNLRFQERPSQFRYSLPIMALPEHLYYKTFCSAICV
jgi:hypothetical protein